MCVCVCRFQVSWIFEGGIKSFSSGIFRRDMKLSLVRSVGLCAGLQRGVHFMVADVEKGKVGMKVWRSAMA